MQLLKRYLAPYYGRMGVGLAIKVGGTLVELLLPYILSHVLILVGEGKTLREILLWGGAMAVCATLACVMNVVANRMAARVARNFSEAVRGDLFDRILRLSSAQTDAFTIPSLDSRVTSDTYNVHHFVGMMQRLGVRAPILLVGGICITLVMDPFLSLVMIASLPLIFLTVWGVSRHGVPLYRRVQGAQDRMVRVVREDVQGIRVIKALSKTEYEHRRFEGVSGEMVRHERRAGLIMGSVNPLMNLLMNGGIVAVVALAAGRVSQGQSEAETVIAFMQYFTLISNAMMSISRMFTMYTKSAASAGRILEVLDAPEDLAVVPSDASIPSTEEPFLVFEGVSFSYRKRKYDLSDVTFSLERGQSLGIIGATGSGKTTLIRLLLRLYDVDAGQIRIGGRDVRTVDKQALYALFGCAMQNDFLYADTVRENVAFGRELTDGEFREALEIAQAAGFVAGLPQGQDTVLAQKGSNLSGGQKQRLLIARAVAARPEILILDDSSSALDYRTDAALRRALRERMSGTTTVTVAQRVSSVKDCDLILVLEEGRIIGRGSHGQLLDSCPTYREIADSQMGGAFVD